MKNKNTENNTFPWPTVAFVTASKEDDGVRMGYMVERHCDIEVKRCVQSKNASLRRCLLLAVWSVVHFVRNSDFADMEMTVYIDDIDLCNELTSNWYGIEHTDVADDGDIVCKIIDDCCHVANVSFEYCGTDEKGIMRHVSDRMREMKIILTLSQK